MHRGSHWEVMSDGFYAVESGKGKRAEAIPKGSILLVLKSGDPERIRFSIARKRYWAFRTQFHSHCELISNRPSPSG